MHGERDIEWRFGVTIPMQGWTLDADNFETRTHSLTLMNRQESRRSDRLKVLPVLPIRVCMLSQDNRHAILNQLQVLLGRIEILELRAHNNNNDEGDIAYEDAKAAIFKI